MPHGRRRSELDPDVRPQRRRATVKKKPRPQIVRPGQTGKGLDPGVSPQVFAPKTRPGARARTTPGRDAATPAKRSVKALRTRPVASRTRTIQAGTERARAEAIASPLKRERAQTGQREGTSAQRSRARALSTAATARGRSRTTGTVNGRPTTLRQATTPRARQVTGRTIVRGIRGRKKRRR